MEARSGMAGRLSGNRRSRRHTEEACVGGTLLSAAFDVIFCVAVRPCSKSKAKSKAADKSVRPTHADQPLRFSSKHPPTKERAHTATAVTIPAQKTGLSCGASTKKWCST